MKTDLRIAICAPNQHSSSETFIANHVKGLKGEIFFLYGSTLPTQYNGQQISSAILIEESKRSGLLSAFKSSPVKKLSDQDRLELFFKQKKIDVVLCEYGTTGARVGQACINIGLPFVVHFHGFDAYHHTTLSQYENQYKDILNQARAIVAVSKDMRNQLIKIGLQEDKIHLLHYGVDTKIFHADSAKQFKPAVVSVGRFVTKKAPHLTLLAFAKILNEFPDAKLIMAGDPGLGNSPELMIACKQIAKALKIQGNVSFPGALDHHAIASLLQQASIFVQHSVVSETGDSEGTPNSVIEASASGLCVIATKHAGIPDVIIDKETGYLVDEFDLESMTACMSEALRNPQKTVEMGQKGSKHVAKEFDLAAQLNKLAIILENAALKQ